MDADTFNLILGLVSLVLGFVSAYNQIKSFMIRLFRTSSEAARRWLKRDEERAALFLAYPSAFIGFVVNRVAFIVFLILISLYLPAAFQLGVIPAPDWLATIAKLVPPTLAGLLLGTLTSVSGDLMKAAKKGRAATSVEG